MVLISDTLQIAISWKEGFQEGFVQGFEEKLQGEFRKELYEKKIEVRTKIAKKMILRKFDIDQIVELTELDRNTVTELTASGSI